MSRKLATKAEIQKCVAASQQIPPPTFPKERKVSQAKKAIQDAAMYEVGKQVDASKTTDDYETSKITKKDTRAIDEEKKAVEALNAWGGCAEEEDDDDF